MLPLLFSDPNCPFCYALEERLHALALEHEVQWCGVQHAPDLPVPTLRSAQPLGDDLHAEVTAIRQFAPEVTIAVPLGKPNTGTAIEHAAAALVNDPITGRRFVRSLYRALWRDGADLSDAQTLARLANEAGTAGAPEPHRAATTAIAAGWQQAWHRSGARGVPLLLRDDGRAIYGLVEPVELADFLQRA